MAPNILLTGVSGYLGGTLLNEWKTSGPGNHGEISALIRNDEQAKEVAVYSVESLVISPKDEVSIVKALVDREITIVYYLIGSYWLESQFTSSKGSHYVAHTDLRSFGHLVTILRPNAGYFAYNAFQIECPDFQIVGSGDRRFNSTGCLAMWPGVPFGSTNNFRGCLPSDERDSPKQTATL
ncbi:hypothetical protein Q7P35_011949 [Cladosporium inversicolor]